MAVFVHIAPARMEKAIRRGGIKPGRALFPGAPKAKTVFAAPVLRDHGMTHQWTREVLKWRREPLIGVRFRLPDSARVSFGRYNEPLREGTAAQAVAAIAALDDPRGQEVLISDNIPAASILAIYALRGVIGWRHRPDAHGAQPCGCPACVLRGEPGGGKLRAAYEAQSADA